MFQKGYGYSTINSVRAALSSVNDTGSEPLVCRFMRGVFNLRPARPRYSSIWDVSIVLNYLRRLVPAANLSLHMLSAKLVTLLALVTGQRCQALHAMDIEFMHLSESRAVFHIEPLLKTNSPKSSATALTICAYREDRCICVIKCLKHYLKRTKHLRTSTKLFISTLSPHAGMTKDTLARWLKIILSKAGVDVSIFKPHSTRAAASSAAFRATDISNVLKTVGWRNESTFAKFYKRPISSDCASALFAKSVLNSKPVSL